jgi:hypothetical protein
MLGTFIQSITIGGVVSIMGGGSSPTCKILASVTGGSGKVVVKSGKKSAAGGAIALPVPN